MHLGEEEPQRSGSDSRFTAVVAATLTVSVLATIVGLVPPALQVAREASRRSQCISNLQRIGAAMLQYESAHGCFPPAFIADKNGKPMHSWRVLILPYLGCQDLYSRYRFDEPWNGPHNATLARQMPSVYYCPSQSAPPGEKTSYAMLVGPHGISDGPTAHGISDSNGEPARTMIVAECGGANLNWTEPRDIDAGTMTALSSASGETQPSADVTNSWHRGVANVLFCDGHVSTISRLIDRKVLETQTRIDKEPAQVASDR
ncbi:MAG: DUF1559 domain-containing protein [Planctomycetaceae bacterium]|nr:DUF1559 domain-containing protein [Planctomycetaceae bacterium]